MALIRSSFETPLDALLEAVRIFGGQSATGRHLGVSQRAVWRWVKQGTVLPAEHVLAIEAATGISRHDLRPDIYPVDLPASAASSLLSSNPSGAPFPEGRTSSRPDASLDPVEASQTVAGGEAAQSFDDPGCAADAPEVGAPPIGKAAA
ncbi:YdaS family helix-turn-helix protein [Blastomonas sp. AAP25]|uniref:transcriptional regulator n=1 Tax=Blastomonas sp. AAP25 TaxID=1523416 RepID=UPI0009E6C265|nr:YdaS family helix-turn-helix protein [Blastomonas sp. AAP25]